MRQICTLVALLIPGIALGCSCIAWPPPAQALNEAEAVFVATVTEARVSDGTLRVRMSVDGVWKDVEATEITVATADNEAACGFPFRLDEQYIVYARALNSEFATTLCDRTQLLSRAGEDLAELGPPTAVGTDAETPVLFGFGVFPNPATEAVRTRLVLDRAAAVQWRIVDTAGRVLRSWTSDLPAGTSEQWVSLNGLPAGRYALEALAADRRRVEWMVVQ
ncbi:MAG: hypothetical protein AAF752_12865 [Bacteroidota bacterium]